MASTARSRRTREAAGAAAGGPERVAPGLQDRARGRVKGLVGRLQFVGDHCAVGVIAAVPLVDAGVEEVAARTTQRESVENAWSQLGVRAVVPEPAGSTVNTIGQRRQVRGVRKRGRGDVWRTQEDAAGASGLVRRDAWRLAVAIIRGGAAGPSRRAVATTPQRRVGS